MPLATSAALDAVIAAYSGPEFRLWELLMGEQIHVGGRASSLDLAARAGIAPGAAASRLHGVDLCCCTGAGMRFLLRQGVGRMTGVDATPAMIELGRERCASAGLDGRADFVESSVCDTGLPTTGFDFVWGEDAWCYVDDKPALAAEAIRLVRPGGTIAFTDWVAGPAGLAGADLERFLAFMKFPNLATFDEWRGHFEPAGCTVIDAADTGRFIPCVELYIAMLEMQLAGDALAILGGDEAALAGLLDGLRFVARLARERRLIQARYVLRLPDGALR